ncbi:low molecular weight protein-tyrosine-phosphatase [Effusibacillus dendaii]|uniref:protein-tyrosine-phosphatase n=1 Tax=Effusibacillus dendaii TaxID=2743772 RepID=A0A7I8D9C5_9BACL|nr:low molecular weight protein-tyrosine-phosphatase [Effusibacillus dendaii]BCJ86724.1 acid phosphatase [Effusibacillus dendaii]
MNKSPIRILFVCLGNICRSPLGEGIFKQLIREQGLEDRFVVDSAGTAGYHTGSLPDPGSRRAAQRRGYSIDDQRARQISSKDLEEFDYVIAMDRSNRRNIERLGKGTAKLLLLREFDPELRTEESDFDVPDPWSLGDDAFEETYMIIERSCRKLLHMLIDRHGLRIDRQN